MKREVDKVDMIFENIKSYCISLILESDLESWSSNNPHYNRSVCLIVDNIIISTFFQKRYKYYNISIYKDNSLDVKDREFDIYLYTMFRSKREKVRRRLLIKKKREILSHVLYKDKYNSMMNTLNILPQRVTRKSKLQNLNGE